MKPKWLKRWGLRCAYGLIVLTQTFFAFQGIADSWLRGHNGWNGSAYHLSARNALRWGLLFPLQYYTGTAVPDADWTYTHHPLGMHLHNTASLWLFGDTEAAIRLVPAIHAILVVLMLIILVRRFYGDLTAVVAGAVYVILPINAIYTNMANHSSGFIFWSLLAFYCYLRFQQVRTLAETSTKSLRRPTAGWFLGLLGAFAMSALWDWPAYYVALLMAFHWFGLGVVRHIRARRKPWQIKADLWLLVPFCVHVLAVFASHFYLVWWAKQSFSELGGTIEARLGISWDEFTVHLSAVPELMFTKPILIVCGLWLCFLLPRLAFKRAHLWDLVPFIYAIGGLAHYMLFKWSATVHSYWAWTALPFVAIATGATIVGCGRLLNKAVLRVFKRWSHWRWVRLVAVTIGLSTGLVLVPLVQRSIELVPDGRRVGGSMWFVAPVRGPVWETYESGREELRFARIVRDLTSRRTGVLRHVSIDRFIPEPRFDVTLDREIVLVGAMSATGVERPGVTEGWVLIGAVTAFSRAEIAEMASHHPYYQFDHLFMLDMRYGHQDVRIWTFEPRPTSAFWWFFVNPFEDPTEAVRLPEAEQAVWDAIARLP